MSFSLLTNLPTELVWKVCSHLDLNSLGKLSQVNQYTRAVAEKIFKKILLARGCSIDSNKSSLRNYKDYVENLVYRIGHIERVFYRNSSIDYMSYLDVDEKTRDHIEDLRSDLEVVGKTRAHSDVPVEKFQSFDLVLRIKDFSSDRHFCYDDSGDLHFCDDDDYGGVPKDILELLALDKGEFSHARMQKLQEYIQARDTLVVWESIAGQAEIHLDLSEAFVSGEVAITKAKEFSAWMDKNSESLRFSDLDLSGKRLTSIPSEIGQLTSLEKLDLFNNYLTSIPSEIGGLEKLQYLNLNHNHLTSLPPEIGQLTNLQSLWLQRNQLTTLPPEFGQLTSLRKLELSNNQLTSLPSEFGQLKYLQELKLFNHKLISIPEEIQALPNFRRFHISKHPLCAVGG